MTLELFGGPLDGTEVSDFIIRLLSDDNQQVAILDESNLMVYYYEIDEQMDTCTYKGSKPMIDGGENE